MEVLKFARINSIYIENPWAVKYISSAVKEKRKAGLAYNKEDIEFGTISDKYCPIYIKDCKNMYKKSDLETGIIISYHTDIGFFKHELTLVPRELVVGIGCKRGTEYSKIMDILEKVLNDNCIYKEAVAKICSIDIKRYEGGIQNTAESLRVPYVTYSSDELKRVRGTFNESEFVKSVTGVGNVCERSALLGAGRDGRLIVGKYAYDGVTVAIASEHIKYDSI